MSDVGESEISMKTVYWIIAAFVIGLIITAFAFVLASHNARLNNMPIELRGELIALRFVNSPDCFAYQEEGRVLAGVLDKSKFTLEQLNRCYKTEPETGFRDFNFRLKLASSDRSINTNNYFNVDKLTIRQKVLVRDGEKISSDELLIFVQDKVRR
ncbi:MAG TPA: hypothetical protein VJI98_04920 [Candidatus Nanoarchaeia archaeon]|nr:hypothetical protein [Candidatus Nanoarchaeia archaeon]